MYRQVEVLPSNRDLQRIVWRDSPERELSHYRLNTVTYGTAPASFLATRCLQQAAFNNLDSFPEASDAIINDFYMDDILSGHDTVQDAIRLKNEITDILSQSGFVLRKFRSNHQSVVESDIQTIEGEYQIFKDESCKTLGLLWNTSMDIFCYSVHLSELKVVTKRTILSTIARIFDPLGLIAPVTIVAKLILQKLWQSKSDWDKSVSMELYTTWNKFFKNLPMINNIKIPRQVTVTNQIKVELHGFCDSSQMAYGCCIYIVSVDSVNKRVSKLLCAKSRVAPLKTVTLPRLELCGALLLAQLSRKCEQALNMVIHEKTYWCDSTITLNWIAGQPNSWKTFVCNRVAEIHELTEQNQWRYISSEQNPADLITRGTTPQCLESAKLWWQGPDFLIGCKESWPNNIILDPVSNTLEKRKPIALSFVNVMGQDQDIFERFSSFKKLIRVTALVLKFVAYLKLRKCHKPYQIKDIEISDLDKATRTLICMVQAVTFSQEIKDLQYNGKVNKNSKLFSLYPFLDQTGIIRVGGRLSNSWLANDKKHPVVLPP
nr:unnamed protein product [Callosobruchus chinensis]